MSGFILPDDIYRAADLASQNIADAWHMLATLCIVRQYPFDIAENQVERYIANQLNEIEAIRKVYHEVANS